MASGLGEPRLRRALRVTPESYDLILLDIALPGISGLELCRRLKAVPLRAQKSFYASRRCYGTFR